MKIRLLVVSAIAMASVFMGAHTPVYAVETEGEQNSAVTENKDDKPATDAATKNASNKVKDGLNSIGGSSASNTNVTTVIKTIINTLLFLVGAVAVVMIIIAGLRMVSSNGDASIIKTAKETILYAVIGLVVAILAWAIVEFIVTSIK